MMVGLPKGTPVSKPSDLTIPGIMQDQCAIFVIERIENPQIENIRQLRRWGKIEDACRSLGKLVTFPDVSEDDFHVINSMKNFFPNQMIVDALNECPCKVDHYKDGLLIVHVADNEPEIFDEVLEKLPSTIPLIFVASNNELFKM